MSRSCSPPRSDSSRSAGRKKMSEGGQKLIMIGAVGQSQVSGKRNRTVSIRSLGSSWSTKERRIYNITYYELAPPALIYLYTCVELCRTSCTHIQVGQEQKAVWHLVSTTRWGSWDDRRMRYYWQIYIEAKTCSAKKLNKNKAMQNFWTTAPVPGGLLGRNFFQCGAKKE